MELRTLRYFVTVAEELNITAASRKLNISQPPLSAQIKNLEFELQTVLFIRGKRHLQLTESGRLLYRRAKEIVNLADKTKEEILSLNNGISGTIFVGVTSGKASEIAAGWFASFLKENPQIRFRIENGGSDELIEKLRGGLVSLAVIAAPYDQNLLNSFYICSEPVCAMLGKDHLSTKDGDAEIPVTTLADTPLIVPGRKSTVESVYKWFRSAKCEPLIVCETENGTDAAALAAQNVGAALFPESVCPKSGGVTVKKLAGVEKRIDYYFVWRKGHPLLTAEEKLIDSIKSQLAEKTATGSL